MEKFSTPQKYIDSLTPEQKEVIQFLHDKIAAMFPQFTPYMYETVFWGGSEQHIICYGKMTYKNSAGKEAEWFQIGLTQQKNYVSVYLTAVEDRQYVAEKYKDTLGKVSVGKSCIRFRKLENVNLDALFVLMKKAVALTPK